LILQRQKSNVFQWSLKPFFQSCIQTRALDSLLGGVALPSSLKLGAMPTALRGHGSDGDPNGDCWSSAMPYTNIISMNQPLSHRKTCRRFNFAGHAHSLTFSCFRRQAFLAKDRTCRWLIEGVERAEAAHGFHHARAHASASLADQANL
jgi:hypothetical protein